MKRTFWLLTLVSVVLWNAGPLPAGDFFVIAGGGKAGTPVNSVPYTINAPGMYYLNGNFTLTDVDGTGITVAASNVTLDFMGFCLTGPGKNSGYSVGIRINDGCGNVEIRNGSLQGFGSWGITSGSNCSEIRLIGLRVSNTGGAGSTGIVLNGVNNLVMGCAIVSNGWFGLYVGANSSVKGNQVYGNTSDGINAADGCQVAGNVVYANLNGILGTNGCLVADNAVYGNTNMGIFVGNNCTVTRNTVYSNTNVGIWAGNYCAISNNAGSKGLVNGSNCALENNALAP